MEERLEETSQQGEEQAVGAEAIASAEAMAAEAELSSDEETQAFDEDRLASILESVLFAAGEPLPLKRLVEVLDGPTPAEVRSALRVVGERLETSGRGVRLLEVAGGYQLRTARENAEWVRAVFRDKPRKLGRAALETLAVIAYRQPITRAEVEAVRGVDIDAVLSTLLQRTLVQVVGRKEAVGRPILYGTTESFLELFGFRDLSELPTLKELPEGAEVNPNEQANTAPEGAEAAAGEPVGAEASPYDGESGGRVGVAGEPGAGEEAGAHEAPAAAGTALAPDEAESGQAAAADVAVLDAGASPDAAEVGDDEDEDPGEDDTGSRRD